jgi:hypothetical protein
VKQFKNGDRVVCVNDEGGWGYALKKGQEYRVVEMPSSGNFVRVGTLTGKYLGGFEPHRFEHLPRLTGTPGPDCNTCWVDGANTSRPRYVCNTGCVPPRKDLMARPAVEHPQEDAFQAPVRVGMLNEAATLTSGARDAEYGPPQENMGCAGELKAVFRKYLRRSISPAEQEALDMVMTKLSRLACGNPKRDTYVDAAGYMSIAGECALAA